MTLQDTQSADLQRRKPGPPRLEHARRRWPAVRVAPDVLALIAVRAAEAEVSSQEWVDHTLRAAL